MEKGLEDIYDEIVDISESDLSPVELISKLEKVIDELQQIKI